MCIYGGKEIYIGIYIEREEGMEVYFLVHLAHVYQIDLVLAPKEADVPLTTRARLGEGRVGCGRNRLWVEHPGRWFMG